MAMGKCLLSCLPLHFLSMFFCSAHSSSLMHLPAHPCPLFPMAPSAPHLPYSTVLPLSSSGCPSLALPLCPCDSHGLAVPSAPSHFLLLPLPSLTPLLSLQTETPLSIFPPL